MGDPSLPEPPVEWSIVVDYHAELTMARLSRASCLTVQRLESGDVSVNPDHGRHEGEWSIPRARR